MAQATEFNLTHEYAIEQGATFDEISFVWADASGTPIDITGYTVEMDIKASVGASTPLAQFTSASGHFTITGASGLIQFNLSSAVTAALDFTMGVYDLFLLGPSNAPARRIVYGQVQLVQRITSFT